MEPKVMQVLVTLASRSGQVVTREELEEGMWPGTVDICTFGSILLYLRDPFLALQKATTHVKEAVIVTDKAIDPNATAPPEKISEDARLAKFLPDAKKRGPCETWWALSQNLIAEFLAFSDFRE